MKRMFTKACSTGTIIWLIYASVSFAWNDETHLAIAKVSGYYKWYNAAAADIAKIKARDIEEANHYVNNTPGAVITPEMVLSQVKHYDQKDKMGHLYGAIIASFRNYLADKKRGEYGEYHMAFCIHYVGDLSMPLHNIYYSPYNKKYHKAMDGIINKEVLDNLHNIKIYPIDVRSEKDLVVEIARIANIAARLGFQLEREDRSLTPAEAYEQISHSASLLKAMLSYSKILIDKK